MIIEMRSVVKYCHQFFLLCIIFCDPLQICLTTGMPGLLPSSSLSLHFNGKLPSSCVHMKCSCIPTTTTGWMLLHYLRMRIVSVLNNIIFLLEHTIYILYSSKFQWSKNFIIFVNYTSENFIHKNFFTKCMACR